MSDMNDKLDKLDQRLDSIDLTLAKNTVLLDEHIKRTNLLEAEIKPIKKHVDGINWLIRAISAVLAIALGLKQLGLF